ncbi:MAG: hypothetical protein JWM10_4129 [Myxococcaceae bacterium]|nr:hypothetical protein [Myxococcaceae bacterium]
MNLRLLASAFGLVVASQSLAGCFFLWDHDGGDVAIPLVPPADEAATFNFTASRGCGPFDRERCTPSRPLLAGVREVMQFELPGATDEVPTTVSSSDPSVVTVGPTVSGSTGGGRYNGSFDVRAGERAGTARVTVSRADGVETTVTVRVDEAAGMDLVEDEGTAHYDRRADRIALRVGERVSMNGYPVNVQGERLYANDGVVWTVPSAGRVSLSWSVMTGERVADDHVYVTAVAPGTEVLTVRAGVVERTLIVDVR